MHAVPPLSKVDRDTVPEADPKLLEQFVQGAQVARRGLENPVDSFRRMGLTTWLLLASGVLLAASQFVFIWFSTIGMVALAVCLVALAALSILREETRTTAISMSILPMTELAHSSIVTRSEFQSAAVLYGLLLLLTLPYRYLFTLDEPTQLTRLKLKGHVFGLPLMVMLGEGLGLVGYGFLQHSYPYQGISLPLVCMGAVVFAFAEEMLLRGLIQQQASRTIHPLLAAGIAAVLYVPLATNRHHLLSLGPAIAMGVVLAAVYHVKHNLLLSTAINAAAKLTYVGLVAAFVLR
jgi:membrane protease YdiL (CAAX protease family)